MAKKDVNAAIQIHRVHPPGPPASRNLAGGHTRPYFASPPPICRAASMGDYCAAVLRRSFS
mgnify:CR=1 FL=1|jgi:hypothetical protein